MVLKWEKEVRISGDGTEKTPSDAFIQGMGKGFGTAVFGGAYPLLTSVFKLIESYHMAYDAAKDVSLDEWDRVKAGLKGALVRGVSKDSPMGS